MTTTLPPTLGGLVAAILRESWRNSPSSDLPVSQAEFDEVAPLLFESGAAGLGWWRIRATDFRQTSSGEMLHQAFRLLSLHAGVHETKIQKVFRTLRAAGIEPILIKGWAVARMYPMPGLRPYGDIDVITGRGQYRLALDAIAASARDCLVDFHAPGFELSDRPLDDLYARSMQVPCGDEQVRVLCPEDHFTLLAIHLLKHGAWRPLWLCDLALMLENSPGFDWELCLGKDKRRRNWILAAAGLAHKILGASITDRHIAAQATNLAPWVVQNVLKQWKTPFARLHPPQSHLAPITYYLRQPRGLFRDLGRRWPSPILATISVNGTFGARRRVRYQVGNWLMRAVRVMVHGSGIVDPLKANQ